MTEDSTSNSLGLDFDQLNIHGQKEATSSKLEFNDSHVVPQDEHANFNPPAPGKEKKKPYVNPERVKTGGNQRDKLTDEALNERMARMREQNEKIKQRRLDVQADEEAFRQTQAHERAKQAHNRQVQENIDRAREQNAKRKMDKVQTREWDSGKPPVNSDKRRMGKTVHEEAIPHVGDSSESTEVIPRLEVPANGQWSRGGHLPVYRGRGRGRGGGQRQPTTDQVDNIEAVVSTGSID